MLHRDLRFHTMSRDDVEFAQTAAWMIEGMIRTNMMEILEDGEDLPCCPACGGVRYVEPQMCRDCDVVKHPCQDVYDVRTMMKKKKATCYDLAAERAARLRLKGYDAHVVIEQRTNAYDQPIAGAFHAVVHVNDDGSVEDPAEELRQQPGKCAGGRSCNCGGHGDHDHDEQDGAGPARVGQVARRRAPGGGYLALPGRVE